MYRIIMMVLRLFYIAPYYMFRIWRLSKNSKMSLEDKYAYLQKVTKAANKAGRVKIHYEGLENLPKEDGFIFYPNHQGLYDVLVFLETCNRPFAFVIKKEARNIILLKQVGDALGSLAIDRKDLRQSMKVISAMTNAVKEGKNFLIFPEGTRSKKGNELLDFKGGSFKGAVKAKCPIVPCALINSFKPFDEKSIKPVEVALLYLKPMYYDEYKDMSTQEIAAIVKDRIEMAIADYLHAEE